jgi:hypothetical protein
VEREQCGRGHIRSLDRRVRNRLIWRNEALMGAAVRQ